MNNQPTNQPTENKTPRDFLKHPWDSITQNSESETVARNIMVILSRTGNVFRPLSRDEYTAERIKDGAFTGTELTLFDKTRSYCETAEAAERFSPAWREV